MPAPMVPRPMTPTEVNVAVAVSVMDACSHAVQPSRVWQPSLPRSVRTYDAHLVARSDRARTHHLGAQPAQPARLALGPVDEGQRVLAEAGDELAAPGVRLVGDDDDGAVGPADVELAPGGKVVVGQVEVDEHLVAGELLALGVLGKELHEAVVHQVELHVGVGRAVRHATTPPLDPRVADEALGDVEVADVQHLALPGTRSTYDGAERPDVARARVDRRQVGGDLLGGPVGAEDPPHPAPPAVATEAEPLLGARDRELGRRARLVVADLDEAVTGVERCVPRDVGVRRQRERTVPLDRRALGRRLQQRGAHPAPGVLGVHRDLVEVRVRLQVAHVGEADGRVPRDQDEARLGRPVVPADGRGGQRIAGEVPEHLLEHREPGVLQGGELREVALPRGAHCVVGHGVTVDSPVVRIVVARCQVDYAGRLSAHLPLATRVLMLKSDGSVLIHSDGGSYKPLNWMSPPCTVREGLSEDGRAEWLVTATKSDDTLRILIDEVLHDTSHDLGVDPGLQKDGVEKHLQELLAEHPATLADGLTLVRREYPTAIGPVDLMCRDADGLSVAVEIKRRGEIDGVEQLTRYLELLNRDPLLAPVRGIFAAQEIKPQARVLATDRGIACAVVDYDALRGLDSSDHRLF